MHVSPCLHSAVLNTLARSLTFCFSLLQYVQSNTKDKYALNRCFIDGNNYLHNKLTGSRKTDGRESEKRTGKGHTDEWFGRGEKADGG